MATAEMVAQFFIELANKRDDDLITNLKLNKLMYYAQGAFLSRTGKPLFDDAIEAWVYGPVVPSIYRKYKVCGSNPIPFTDEDSISTDDFTSEELDALFDVVREFGKYTGNALVSMTHEADTPWSKCYTGGSSVIPKDVICEYFQENLVPHFKISDSCELVDALPKEWYDPAEDAEWKAYL